MVIVILTVQLNASAFSMSTPVMMDAEEKANVHEVLEHHSMPRNMHLSMHRTGSTEPTSSDTVFLVNQPSDSGTDCDVFCYDCINHCVVFLFGYDTSPQTVVSGVACGLPNVLLLPVPDILFRPPIAG
ncbi:MAG: hypothetical protein WD772_08815 [Pseudohongiellaceae bacterium]